VSGDPFQILALRRLRRALAEAGVYPAGLDDGAVERLAAAFGAQISWRPGRVKLGAPRGVRLGEPVMLAEQPVAPETAAHEEHEDAPHLCEICLRNASAEGSPLIAEAGA